ncbi:MAG TPA: transcriptional regulator [Cyanobacteria bacterium UBA11149]|nr:transcriptional regulator [Cyanobacteria bacterium UBA11367]HBE59283.1 transcriptional regulator [Cyanobacteria bacterium UBA11366]HBK64848.1 transcriptional regulator [Cyanobacteria bacterium UBA11166]HBR76246.1 transcriptional regulator [Cyanobacteria bacterium UBA11159]HBS67703.1 transcriptional regulator [Cyanobacteria bacterium UBA11153]HBW91837.1 transcriptional regulator [Cyanobacteria bacterium UBA11149]HCA96089.1 transcriptional regulator [Cyanobacteria bacterium UBA9226]
MSYSITNRCIQCDTCEPLCPTGAISRKEDRYSIDLNLCNNCEDLPAPQCIIACPVNAPVPVQAKKGRYKIDAARILPSANIFTNGKNHPFASAIAIWELSNILVQGASLPWEIEDTGELYYHRQILNGKGKIVYRIANPLAVEPKIALKDNEAFLIMQSFDIRAACLNLIYAAHITALDRPWEEEFIINDLQIEEYLGIDKRKDLSKSAKLSLIKELAQQPCNLIASIDLPSQGKVKGVSIKNSPLWHLLEIQHHFQEDDSGSKHLIGLTFRIKAGEWTKIFLNRQGCKERKSFYQYGTLPKVILITVMSIWQQHPGAARMLIWLLFKTKMGKEQRITVPTLMRVAYGDKKFNTLSSQKEERKRLMKIFENDLEVISYYGIIPVFDPVTYPPEIQPLWVKLQNIPEEAEAALEFWIADGSQNNRLTDVAPRGKWNRLMNGRILYFETPPEWQSSTKMKAVQPRKKQEKTKTKSSIELSPEQIIEARKTRLLSQRELASLTGKSQSWIRDIENGRFRVKEEDQMLLRKVLGMI